MEPTHGATRRRAGAPLAREPVSVVVADLHLRPMDGLDLLDELERADQSAR